MSSVKRVMLLLGLFPFFEPGSWDAGTNQGKDQFITKDIPYNHYLWSHDRRH
jgi:hypothetical protein